MKTASIAILVLMTACTMGGDPATTTSSEAPVIATTGSTVGIDSTTTSSTTTLPDLSGAVAGSAGIGDELYPNLGNGGYEVDHYSLDLVIDPAANTLSGTAELQSRVGDEALRSFNLDLVGLSVSSVTVAGTDAEWNHEGRELTITPSQALASGSDFTVRVTYAGTPTQTSGLPFGGGWRRAADGIYVIDQPDGAATWFPVNDHPLDPATFSITIDAPEGFETVVSGVPATDIDDPSPDRWEIPEQTAPYLVAMAVGQYERIDQGVAEGVALTLYVPPDLPDPVRSVFDAHGEMLAFYGERFGPYPFDRYGAVVIDDPGLAAALETQTLSTFGIPAVSGDVAAHELVHQWFGDMVRVADWTDVWLNEGFATFGQWMWTEETVGADAYRAAIARAYSLMSGAAFVQDGVDDPAGQAATAFGPPAEPRADDLFNASVYLRGGLTLVHIRDVIGDEAMWELASEWFRRFQGSTASTDDFLALVGELHGNDLVMVVEAHLFDPVPPAMPERGLEPVG